MVLKQLNFIQNVIKNRIYSSGRAALKERKIELEKSCLYKLEKKIFSDGDF
jgi:hypothetical protein